MPKIKARIERYDSRLQKWEKETVGSNYHTWIVFNHHITTWPEFAYRLYGENHGLLEAYHVGTVSRFNPPTLPSKTDFYGNKENDNYPYYEKFLREIPTRK